MYQFLRTCLVYLKLKLQEVLTYRVVIFSWSVVAAIPLVVAASIWLNSEALYPSFGGYMRSEIIAYYLLFFLLNQIFSSYVFFSVQHEIIDGDLPFHLLKPFPYFMTKTLQEVGWRSMDTLFRFPLYAAVVLVGAPFLYPALSGSSWLLFLLAVFVGVAMYHLIAFLFGLLAFWFTRVEGFHSLYFVSFIFLSGEIVPIHLYFEPFRTAARLLPFRYIYSFPVEMYLGKLSAAEQVFGVSVGFFWLFVLAGLWNTLWRRGLATYGAFGG